MEASVIPFGPGGLSFLGLYFLILVAIGWYGSKARESHSLKDFYLGGKGIGLSLIHISEPRDGLLSRMPSSA